MARKKSHAIYWVIGIIVVLVLFGSIGISKLNSTKDFTVVCKKVTPSGGLNTLCEITSPSLTCPEYEQYGFPCSGDNLCQSQSPIDCASESDLDILNCGSNKIYSTANG